MNSNDPDKVEKNASSAYQPAYSSLIEPSIIAMNNISALGAIKEDTKSEVEEEDTERMKLVYNTN